MTRRLHEGNEELRKRRLSYTPEMISVLRDAMARYGQGNESKPGYKHCKAILDNYDAKVNGTPESTYNERGRKGAPNLSNFEDMKSFFDKFDKNSATEDDWLKYNLYGGDKMKKMVDSKLGNERRSVKDLNDRKRKEKKKMTDTFQGGTKPMSTGSGNIIYPFESRKVEGVMLGEEAIRAMIGDTVRKMLL